MQEPVNLPYLGLVSHELKTVENSEVVSHTVSDVHKIVLLLKGGGTGQIGRIRVPAKRPVGWFLPAGQPEILDLRGHIDMWWFSFGWPSLDLASIGNKILRLEWLGKSRQTHRLKQIDSADASRMVEHFKLLQRASSRWELTGEMEVRSYLLMLTAFYIDLPDEPPRTDGHRALQHFRDLIDERAFEEISIDELASNAEMSAEHLRNLFYERYGVRPHTYRAGLRMAKARALLCESNMNVKEIAHLVGYSDALYFSKAFKDRYGVNPSDMIRQFRR